MLRDYSAYCNNPFVSGMMRKLSREAELWHAPATLKQTAELAERVKFYKDIPGMTPEATKPPPSLKALLASVFKVVTGVDHETALAAAAATATPGATAGADATNTAQVANATDADAADADLDARADAAPVQVS